MAGIRLGVMPWSSLRPEISTCVELETSVEHDLPAVLQAMIGKQHAAVTVAKMATIGRFVIDSRIIEATPAAAAMYGVEDPQELVGCWQSLLQHPDDVWLGRVMAQARRRGCMVPDIYISRIRQIRSPNTYVTVTKDVAQLAIGPDVYWFTVLSEANGPPLIEEENIWERYHIPGDVFSYLANCVSVAEMERALSSKGAGISDTFDPTDPDTFRMLDISLGESVRLADESYLHRCARCTAIWKTASPTPARCAKRVCHSPEWRTLPRVLQALDRDSVTPEMVLASKQPRRKTTRK